MSRPKPRRAPKRDTVDAVLRAAANDSPILMWTSDATGNCNFVNRAKLAFTGHTLRQELGSGWLDAVHPDDREGLFDLWQEAVTARRTFIATYRLRRADGTYRLMVDHGAPRSASRGRRYTGHVGSIAEVTDRIHSKATGSGEPRFERLMENARAMIYRTRYLPTKAIEYVSPGCVEITGRTPAEFYADPDLPRKCVHPDDAHLVIANTHEASDLQADVTLRWLHPDGRIVWSDHRRVLIRDEKGRAIAVEGIARDVTDRVEVQQQLRDSEEQMRQLALRMESTREEERKWLARELHDELGQTLTAIKLELARATTLFRQERLTSESVDRLQSLIGLTEIAISTIKRITTDIRPATLDHLGLPAAVRWEAMTFRARTGLRCHVTADKEKTTLGAEQETTLFRIFQESLTNVVRHAQASAVQVKLTERRGMFEMRVRDNGRGISDLEARDPKAIGLLGMRERAASIGGRFEIAGKKGKGTTVSVRVIIGAHAKPQLEVERQVPSRRQTR